MAYLLKIDGEIPKRCNGCMFGRRRDNMSSYCWWRPEDGVQCDHEEAGRPEYCPLKEIPEKREQYVWQVSFARDMEGYLW